MWQWGLNPKKSSKAWIAMMAPGGELLGARFRPGEEFYQ
jgi:hypothetical protein